MQYSSLLLYISFCCHIPGLAPDVHHSSDEEHSSQQRDILLFSQAMRLAKHRDQQYLIHPELTHKRLSQSRLSADGAYRTPASLGQMRTYCWPHVIASFEVAHDAGATRVSVARLRSEVPHLQVQRLRRRS